MFSIYGSKLPVYSHIGSLFFIPYLFNSLQLNETYSRRGDVLRCERHPSLQVIIGQIDECKNKHLLPSCYWDPVELARPRSLSHYRSLYDVMFVDEKASGRMVKYLTSKSIFNL